MLLTIEGFTYMIYHRMVEWNENPREHSDSAGSVRTGKKGVSVQNHFFSGKLFGERTSHHFFRPPEQGWGWPCTHPDSQGDWYFMSGFEGDTNSRKNLAFLNNTDNFPKGMCTEDVTCITVSNPSAGDTTSPASSPPGNSCRDIPHKKNDIVVYPGRSVLYSRQFRPLNQINSTEDKKPQSGEP